MEIAIGVAPFGANCGLKHPNRLLGHAHEGTFFEQNFSERAKPTDDTEAKATN
jgi:hypothetical protein